MYDVTIIGAGVVGGMLARELSKYRLSVCLLERGNDVACGASKANSGIVHGGYDPVPGTLKAKLNTVGVEKLFNTAEELHVPYRRNGSLVCAFSEAENETVQKLYNRGQENNIPNLKVLSGEEVRKIEPNLSESVTSALLVENAGIICPYELTIAAVGNAMDNGATLKTDFEVVGIEKNENGFVITSVDGETVESRFAVNCAGCYSDKIAQMIGDNSFEIIPRAGEYLLLDKNEGKRVSYTIFQVPTADGKGILVSPTVDGNLLTGPTALAVETPENNETTLDGLDTVRKLALKSVPSVDFRQVITGFSGVRSSEKNGDFIIEESKAAKGFVNVAAIDSPGLTCSAAIAEYVTELLESIGLDLTLNPDFDGRRENPHLFHTMTTEEKNEYIKAHPQYGRIICRCEGVSEGEIRDAIRRNPPAHDIDGVKRRTRSGMGRCQGGFCAPYVMKLLSEENNVPFETVTKSGKNAEMVVGRIEP
ncbi:MAG: NAD(P)/FAD-dependent oxidoreductase [Clostridia bacterium]|nr:NAD(P)/FAD-dependent oxidoreductase [Clostridia bacterium]